MATRNRRKPKVTREVEVVPAMLWLAFGVLLGLGLAVYLLLAGVLPGKVSTASQSSQAPRTTNDELAAEGAADVDAEPKWDYYILPEMDVVVDDAELQKISEVPPRGSTAASDVYLLQAGSFRDSADAESRKAALAFLGLVAEITTVTVNGKLWHRVQVGPYTSARELDLARRELRNNNIKAMPIKAVQ